MHDRTRGDAGVDGANVVPGAYSSAFSAEARDGDAARDELGFCGTCTATLIDWIQLVQLGRRDAVLSVLSHDGRHATLWCREGDIVDAECDGALGEDAVFRALSWTGGRVYVELDGAIVRAPRITSSTSGLLLRAAYRRDSGVHEIAAGTEALDGAGAAAELDVGDDKTEVSGPAELPPVEGSPLEDPLASGRSRLSLRFVLAGSLSVLSIFLALFVAFVRIGGTPARPDHAADSAPGRLHFAAVATPARPTARPTRSGDVASAPAPEVTPPALGRPVPSPVSSTGARGVPARRRAPVALAKRAPAPVSGALVLDQPRAPRARALAPAPAPIKVDLIPDPAPAPRPQVQIIGSTEVRAQPHIQIIQDRKPRIERVE